MLYLVIDALGDGGALALGVALEQGAARNLVHLWCCGAFSAASDPGEAGPGFRALTHACDEREAGRGWTVTRSGVVHRARPLLLEMEHGLPWGM
eukprot:3336179-Prymnesium_polylepis.1